MGEGKHGEIGWRREEGWEIGGGERSYLLRLGGWVWGVWGLRTLIQDGAVDGYDFR